MIRKVTVQKINVRKTAILSAVICSLVGLLTGITDALVNGIREGLLSPVTSTLIPGTGIWVVIILPVAGLFSGFFTGLILGWLYNLVSEVTGGIDFEIVDKG